MERYDLDVDTLTNAIDVDGEIWSTYGVNAQPAWVFVDGDTGTVERHFGALEPDQLRQALDDLS